MPGSVAEVFDGYPDAVRPRMLSLRALILETAGTIPGVGPLEESLRWGEPAYLTPESRSGTTLRLSWKPSAPDEAGVCVHCRTTLVERFRREEPTLDYDGNRRVVVREGAPLQKAALARFIAAALTYHRDRAGRR